MGRKRDSGEPNHTCPIIDNAIRFVSHHFDTGEPISKGEIDRAVAELEKVREANTELRAWGSGLYDNLLAEQERADEAERELKDARDEIDDLRSQNKRLVKELESAESKIERMESANG